MPPQPDASAASSLATLLRRPRRISRGVRVMACTAQCMACSSAAPASRTLLDFVARRRQDSSRYARACRSTVSAPIRMRRQHNSAPSTGYAHHPVHPRVRALHIAATSDESTTACAVYGVGRAVIELTIVACVARVLERWCATAPGAADRRAGRRASRVACRACIEIAHLYHTSDFTQRLVLRIPVLRCPRVSVIF